MHAYIYTQYKTEVYGFNSVDKIIRVTFVGAHIEFTYNGDSTLQVSGESPEFWIFADGHHSPKLCSGV